MCVKIFYNKKNQHDARTDNNFCEKRHAFNNINKNNIIPLMLFLFMLFQVDARCINVCIA